MDRDQLLSHPSIFVLIRWSNFYFYNRCQLQEDEGEGEEDEGEEDEEDGGEEDEEGEEEEGEGDEAAAASEDWDVKRFGSCKRKDELATLLSVLTFFVSHLL